MNMFDQLIYAVLSPDVTIEEAIRHSEDITGKDERSGGDTEQLFADNLKQRFGIGRMFKSKNQPSGAFTKAHEDLKRGLISWYSGSEKQDKIDHVDFVVNVAATPKEAAVLQLAKGEFNNILGLGETDLNSPEFNAFWDDVTYQKEKESAYRLAMSTIEKNQKVDIKTFEVKSYKSDTKHMHQKGGAVLAELVGGGGYPGWLKGKADFIAYRENGNLAIPSSPSNDISDGFLIVNRHQLLNYVNATVSQDKVTSDKNQAWYTLYRRRDREGNPKKDLVTHIDLVDAKKSGVFMEFWPDKI